MSEILEQYAKASDRVSEVMGELEKRLESAIALELEQFHMKYGFLPADIDVNMVIARDIADQLPKHRFAGVVCTALSVER